MRKLTTLVASAAVALTLLGQTSAPVEARGGWGHGGGHHGGWGHVLVRKVDEGFRSGD